MERGADTAPMGTGRVRTKSLRLQEAEEHAAETPRAASRTNWITQQTQQTATEQELGAHPIDQVAGGGASQGESTLRPAQRSDGDAAEAAAADHAPEPVPEIEPLCLPAADNQPAMDAYVYQMR